MKIGNEQQRTGNGFWPSHAPGFTLVEMVIYVALIGIVMSSAVLFIFNLVRTYTRYRVEREVATNVRLAMDYMTRETKSADRIYTPTSRFDSHPGQLSLESSLSLPTDETSTFVDFYVDNGKLYLRRESQNPFPITSDRVDVRNLVFRYLSPTSTAQIVLINLTVDFRAPSNHPQYQYSSSLTSSASIRGQY